MIRELNSEHENVKENYMVEKTVQEMTNNQIFVILMSNVQSMVNGVSGQNIAHAVSHVVKELKPELEHVLVDFMVAIIVMEKVNKPKLVIQTRNAQLMASGHHGDNGAAVARHVVKELKLDPDHVHNQNMVEKLVMVVHLQNPKIANSKRPVSINQFVLANNTNSSVSHV